MLVWRQRFGGSWTCHDVEAGEALLVFGIETFGGTAATWDLFSKLRRCFQNWKSVVVLPYTVSRRTAK
jgi:hypothetical protein